MALKRNQTLARVLPKTQLNNTKMALSSEHRDSHDGVSLPKNESNLPLWMGVGWKAYQTQSQKVGVLFNWHTCPGKGVNADKESKRQRPGLALSKGDPNLERAHRAKTILQCLSCPRFRPASFNSRTLSDKDVDLTFLNFFYKLPFILNFQYDLRWTLTHSKESKPPCVLLH